MKKLFLTLSVVVLITAIMVAACGCSKVAQTDKLSNPLVGDETYVYDVFYNTAVVGSLTIAWTDINNAKVGKEAGCDFSMGEYVNNSFTGKRLSSTLNMDNGDSIMSDVLYKASFAPVASNKVIVKDDKTSTAYVHYSSGKVNISTTVNAIKTESSLKVKSPYYDNEMLYAVIRASDIHDDSYSMSYSMPSALTRSVDTMSIVKSSALENVNLTEISSEAIPCYQFSITISNNSYAGSYTVFLAKTNLPVTSANSSISAVKKAVVKIVEGDYSYILKSISAE